MYLTNDGECHYKRHEGNRPLLMKDRTWLSREWFVQ